MNDSWLKMWFNKIYFVVCHFRFSLEAFKQMKFLILSLEINFEYFVQSDEKYCSVNKYTKILILNFFHHLRLSVSGTETKNLFSTRSQNDKNLNNQSLKKDRTMLTIFCLIRRNFRSSQEVLILFWLVFYCFT